MPHGSRRVGVRRCVRSEGSSGAAGGGGSCIVSPPSTRKARRRSSEKREPGRTGPLRDDCRARNGSSVSWRRQSRSTSSRRENRTARVAETLAFGCFRRARLTRAKKRAPEQHSQTDEIVQVRRGGSREFDYSAHATGYEQNQRSIRATSAGTRTVPTEDVLDQFLAEAPGQWARVQ